MQPPETDGQWYDVAEERTETSDLETLDETGAWRGLQWLNAFEILVGPPINFDKQKENRAAHLLHCRLHALPSSARAPVVQVKQAA